MKCGDIRAFFSQIAGKSFSTPFPQIDVGFLTTNGYVSVMPKDEYDRASAEVASLVKMNLDLYQEKLEESGAAAALREEVKKTHSILFHFEGREKQEAELENEERARNALIKEHADVVQKDSEITQLIQKKSTIDRMVQYNGGYAALTGLGVVTLNDLNVRNYRVSDNDFAQFIDETRETSAELRSISERGTYHVANLKSAFPVQELSHLWSVAIGLGKLEGDPNLVGERFVHALDIIEHFDSTLENKMAAAELMTSVRQGPALSLADNSDLQNIKGPLSGLDHDLRHRDHVPKELSASIAAMMMFGRRFDGTYPTDNYAAYAKLTPSFESAAILSVVNAPVDQLSGKFISFRGMFGAWGYQLSEDTELASAYLAASDLQPGDVRAKLAIVTDGLKNYLAYPLVAGAILASIPTLEANETLDLLEKAYSVLAPYAGGMERSEVVSLGVRMIHGIRNDLVKQLDPTAKIANTPIQFIHGPSPVFFPFRGPLIIAHSNYFTRYSGIGGYHPAHVHGFGGGFGG